MENFFYYAEICESLNNLCLIFIIFSILLSIAYTIASQVFSEEEANAENAENAVVVKNIRKWLKRFIISSFISIFLYVVLPSKQTLYLMKGFGIIEKTLNDSTAKHLPSKTIELLNEYLDKELEQLKENK